MAIEKWTRASERERERDFTGNYRARVEKRIRVRVREFERVQRGKHQRVEERKFERSRANAQKRHRTSHTYLNRLRVKLLNCTRQRDHGCIVLDQLLVQS
jgi:hypothetical protein